jgi:CRP-like cAMP-binding protein
MEGTCIGEMSALDASAARSATVEAKTAVVALKGPESTFRVALERHPIAFKALAQLLAVRCGVD